MFHKYNPFKFIPRYIRCQNPDKFQFKFSAILCLRQKVVGVRESLMLPVNSHILKMAAMLKPSAEYNRRAIIEDFHAGRSATEVIRFFEYPRSTIYVVAKYMALEEFNVKFQYASEEESLERMHHEDSRSR